MVMAKKIHQHRFYTPIGVAAENRAFHGEYCECGARRCIGETGGEKCRMAAMPGHRYCNYCWIRGYKYHEQAHFESRRPALPYALGEDPKG